MKTRKECGWRWWARLFLVFALWWAYPETPDVVDAQGAIQHRNITVLASAAQTASGIGGGVDITPCVLFNALTTPEYDFAQVIVTAGSGTVTAWKVWLETSGDGVNWAPLPSWSTVTFSGTATAGTHLIVNETSLVTSGNASGFYSAPLTNVRARWTLTGTTPSETFSVILSCYS